MCVLRTENISPGIRAGYTQGQGRQTESAAQRQARSNSREHTSATPETSVEDDTIISTKGGHTAIANTTIQYTRNPFQHKALSEIYSSSGSLPPPPSGRPTLPSPMMHGSKRPLSSQPRVTPPVPHTRYTGSVLAGWSPSLSIFERSSMYVS
jgi:hypothetical protein